MAGDIIGCLIDMDAGTISYSRLVSVFSSPKVISLGNEVK